jgi:hypothetical protein
VFSGSGSQDQQHSLSEITQALQQEVVTYLVLQRPVQNITTGNNSTFSMMLSTCGNALFWPDARDSIANGLGAHLLKAQNAPKDVIPRVFSGHNVNYMVDTNEHRKETLMDKIRRALGWVWDHRSEIGAGLSSAVNMAAPFLMAGKTNSEPTIVRASYLNCIRTTH